MSELTTPIRIDIPGVGSIESADLYLKSEVDKVIAELKKERDWLAKDRAQAYDDLEKRAQLNIKQEESIRHSNHKRCLLRSVIAEMNATHFKDLFYGAGSEALADEYNKQITIHYKWQKRWLALADKYGKGK